MSLAGLKKQFNKANQVSIDGYFPSCDDSVSSRE